MSSSNVSPIPEGFHAVTPYLVASDARAVIDFLQRAFDATVCERLDDEKGRIRHAPLKIGDSMLMLTDGNEDCPPAAAAPPLIISLAHTLTAGRLLRE